MNVHCMKIFHPSKYRVTISRTIFPYAYPRFAGQWKEISSDGSQLAENFLQSSRPKANRRIPGLKGNVKFRFAIRVNPISPENFANFLP